MDAAAERFLARLDGARRTGPGRWIAKCPAHEDKTPSLSVREADDGRILLKCWSGCSASEVVGAVGLTLAALFPRPLPGAGPIPSRERWAPAWRDAWQALARESLIASIAAADAARGVPITSEDADRAALAAWRLAEAASTLTGGARHV